MRGKEGEAFDRQPLAYASLTRGDRLSCGCDRKRPRMKLKRRTIEPLYSNRRLNRRMRIVIDQFKILEMELIDRLGMRLDQHSWQWPREARKLQPSLIKMVVVQMHITKRVNEITWFQSGYFGHHHGQQRIAGDIERHAQKIVGAALVELATEPSARDIELKQQVTWRQRHTINVGDVPCGHDQPPRMRIGADRVLHFRDLIDRAAVGRGPRSPLVAVNGTEIAIFIGPLVPDRYLVFFQPSDVRIATQEPQQFDNDRPQVQFFGRQQRKTVGKVESQLPTKQAACSGSGTVIAIDAGVDNFF